MILVFRNGNRFSQIGFLQFVMHVALRREMIAEELDQRRAQHKALLDLSDPESSVCYAMSGQSGPHAYLYLVRRLSKGLEEEIGGSVDAIGSGFMVKLDAMGNLNCTLKQFGIDIKGKGGE